MKPHVKLDQEYTKEEIEQIFNTNFGSRIKGITLRRWSDRIPYILLFSRADGPYTDSIQDEIFYYDGEGLNKHQQLTAANKALIESNQTSRIIYGFRQEHQQGQWKYIGILKVIDYEYIPKNGFKTYEFKLKVEELEISERYSPELAEIIESSEQPEPRLTDEAKTTETKSRRKARNVAFSGKIKEIYDYTCAVCGKRRSTSANYPEVEAAHIYPKSKNGSDDLRNGIALCKLHHWAFDGGLFSITDDLTISVF